MKFGRLANAALLFATTANADPVVRFASQHNLNYAEGVCKFIQRDIGLDSEAKTECALATDPRALGRKLELDVATNFASNRRCAGITVVRGWDRKYDGGDGKEYLAAGATEHWDLLLDFMPGSKKHEWYLFYLNSNGNIKDSFAEEGTAAQIAETVCAIVTKQGATIR